ncbi:MAG: NADPH:quinone reductase [Pseudomonadota bacterium]
MRAMGYSEFGGAEDVLNPHMLPTPDPAPGEVLVELRCSGVNPSDVKARAGARPGVPKPPFPLIIPHSDGAGVVVKTGDGVDESRIGRRVWIWNGQWQRAFGTCATHICLPAPQVVDMPEDVQFETGAQLGIPGLTAAHAVFAAGPVAGKRVLINGAAGTVGYLATQLAVWGGAHVVATARGTGIERVKDAGAHHVMAYSSDELATQIRETGGPIDHVVEVEFGVNADLISDVIAENGSICAYGSAKNMRPVIPFYPLMFKAVTLHIALIYLLQPDLRNAAITRLHKALACDALSVPVAQIYDLSRAASAHDSVMAGARHGGILVACA